MRFSGETGRLVSAHNICNIFEGSRLFVVDYNYRMSSSPQICFQTERYRWSNRVAKQVQKSMTSDRTCVGHAKARLSQLELRKPEF